MKYIASLIIVTILLQACNNQPKKETTTKSIEKSNNFEVQNFSPITNWKTKSDSNTFLIEMDYTDAIDSGFLIPSMNQTENGKFEFEFSINNKNTGSKQYYYKIYYQNESYKFPEFNNVNPKNQHELAHENFYGSWTETSQRFKKTKKIAANQALKISDSFQIVGNPRNEKKYYYQDKNNRWKRNPRTGSYSFLLVVCQEETYTEIPDCVKDINLINNTTYVNPYFYFLYGEGKNISNTASIKSQIQLKVFAKPNLGNGIFINKEKFKTENIEEYFCETCGESEQLRKEASFSQFIHYIDASTKLMNIPVIADVLQNEYSQTEYNWNKSFYPKNELLGLLPKTAPEPCQTVFSDSNENKIVIKNPKSEWGNWQKQSVGIISRHGFTYGKHTVKANLTELLNKEGVWNGLTNAIWMIYQGGGGGGAWNARRPCKKEGYMATYWGGRDDKRKETVSYSEIDFEILKTVPYCPRGTYPPKYLDPIANLSDFNAWNPDFPPSVEANRHNIIVACTNWDMACPQPANYNSGCQPIEYKDTTYESHRWEKVYRALTQKSPQADDKVFGGEYFYFQIDWRPTEIIWRIGTDKNNLEIVGYMNESVTSIPNNQMLMIVTQEFHNTKWWPGSPYEQGFIPFPKNDIFGEILEYTVE